MRDWFESLEQRERLIVTVGAFVVLIAVIYTLIWQPLQSAHAERTQSIETWQRSLTQLRTLQAMGATNASTRPVAVTSQAPLVVVDQTLRARSLDRALKRSQPTSSNGIRVEFEGVVFDDAVTWLGELSVQHSMHVTQGSISNTQLTGPGRVNATFTLERAP